MRKALVFVLALMLVFGLFGAGPVMANDNIDWRVGVEIDPADAFDETKIVRTFTYDGVEYEDLSVVHARDNVFKVSWFSDYFIPKMEWHNERFLADGIQPLPVTIDDVIVDKKLFVREFCIGAWEYPNWDIVSINGEPWQNTVYVDVIVDRVGEIVKPTELLGDRSSEAWAMFMDPRTNGASHVWFGDPYSPDYPASRWTAVTDYTVDKITKYNPLNNGKPFDFDSWQWPPGNGSMGNQTEQDQAPAKDIVETFPNPEWQQGAILTIGSPQVTIINAGASKQNVLSVVPETISGRTMIPLRGVLDELGYQLDYDGEKEVVEIVGYGQVITLVLGKGTAMVDGKEIELDQPATIKNGRTLVPLRFVSESLGFEVDYENGKITLSK